MGERNIHKFSTVSNVGGVGMGNCFEMNLKGVVACPACRKEFVFAYHDAKGHASVPCVRCGRIIMVDYGRLQATLITPKPRKT